MRNRLKKIIRESIEKVLFEHQTSEPWFERGDDVTEAVMKYLKYSQYGERNPMFSIEANKIHSGLMKSMWLFPEEPEDRKKFANILYYIKVLLKHNWSFSIKVDEDGDQWVITFKDFADDIRRPTKVYTNDIGEGYYASFSPFKSRMGEGINCSGHERRFNGDYGYSYYTKASMTDEMQQKIRSMGLVPCLFVTGSYHENFLYALGIIPEFADKLEHAKINEDGLHFDCVFDETKR